MFQNLNANSKYVVSISMRNAVGEGPAATAEVVTPPEASGELLLFVLLTGETNFNFNR